MKFLSVALIALFSMSSTAFWLTDFQMAQAQAKAKKQPILLNFSGSDWCLPCIKMKKTIFETETFTTYAAQNLVLINADFPRSKKKLLDKTLQAANDKLAEKYNPTGTFPLTLLLDADGRVLKKWEGLPKMTPEMFVEALKL